MILIPSVIKIKKTYMSIILHNCKKIEIRESSVEGWGVFAIDNIFKGEVLEEVPFILFPRFTTLGKGLYDLLNSNGFLSSSEKYNENLRQNFKFKDAEKFYFKWYPPVPFEGERSAFTVLPLGYGPIYNTSNTDNNAGWRVKEKTFIFQAERDITKDEEIRTFYGYFVGQDGSIFNCDSVFNLGLDYDISGKVKCKVIRFGNLEQFEQGKQSPIYSRIAHLFSFSKESLWISKISALLPNGEEKVAFDVPLDINLTSIYQKISEFKNSQFPLIKITFEYEDKNNNNKMQEHIVFRK